MYRCRICAEAITPFIDFGQMPIGNAFLDEADLDSEYFYHMQVGVCGACSTLQLLEVPDPGQMFHDHYAYFASTSAYMVRHFGELADQLMRDFVAQDHPFVVEIGSNDGITLKNFADAGIPHLGVDPSSNVAEAAQQKGIDVLIEFFNRDTARTIAERYGSADVIISTNTMHHIEDTNSVAEGIAHLLKPAGVFVQEDPYLGDMIERTAYDQLYAEHMYIWSITALSNVFGRYGMEIFDVEHNDFHGGCMRYYMCRTGAHRPTERLLEAKQHEATLGLGKTDTFDRFREACEESRRRLRACLSRVAEEGGRVTGYGATAKSATVINYCGLTPDDIPFISDSTPSKQNKFSPGAHIPIRPPAYFAAHFPDHAILFAWNHFDEINAKERAYRESGGKWIIPIGPVDVV